jgi:phosphoglycolate phosphatase
MTEKILLFDIDGTMLSSGGSGQQAMEQVLLEQFGVPEIKTEIPSAGRTDRAIITDLFRDHDIQLNDASFEQFKHAYFRVLPDFLRQKTGCVLNGVVALLNKLSALPQVKLGLLTGNFREGARIKLSSFGLDHYFDVGGFGDHHHHRDDVAREAFRAVQTVCLKEISPSNIWVIGDTPADIICARAIGAKVMAVCTGVDEAELLATHMPDSLVDDLANLEEVSSILLK